VRTVSNPTRLAVALVIGLLATIVTTLVLDRLRQESGPPAGTASPSAAAIVPADPTAWEDVAWAPVPAEPGLLGGPLDQRMSMIVEGGPGFVAGGVTAVGRPGAEMGRGTVWLSETGEEWRPVVIEAGVRAGDVSEVYVLAAGPRGIVAWGSVCCGVEGPATWWSADGLAWEREVLPEGFGRDSSVNRIAAGEDGFVAVGSKGMQMAIWTSADGRVWTTVDPDRAGLVRGALYSVVRDGQGWLAVGARDDRETGDGALWRSKDLSSWHALADAAPLAGREEVTLNDVFPFGAGYLLVGSSGTHEERVRCENMGVDAGHLAMAGDLALVCGWGHDAQWWSPDGKTWQLLPRTTNDEGDQLPPFRPDGRGLMSYGPVRAGGPGLVTIGYDFAGRNGPNDVRGVWTTADGRHWEPVGQARQFPPDSSVESMVVVGRRIIAVGSRGWVPAPNAPDEGTPEDAAVWIGQILP
jgi:hypothetical protein